MVCEHFDVCPLKKGCDTCPQWYRSYVGACAERNIEPTAMRPQNFSAMNMPAEGEKMRIEDAAKKLGVSERTVKDYITKGRLEKSDDGVSDESVEAYIERRKMNMQKIVHIDNIDIKSAPDETLVYVELGLLKEAIAEAKRMGRTEGYAEAKREFETGKLDRKTLAELIPKYRGMR